MNYIKKLSPYKKLNIVVSDEDDFSHYILEYKNKKVTGIKLQCNKKIKGFYDLDKFRFLRDDVKKLKVLISAIYKGKTVFKQLKLDGTNDKTKTLYLAQIL